MKERPILFTGAMVRALLDGSKTQTRRIMKPQPEPTPADYPGPAGHWWPSNNVQSMVYVEQELQDQKGNWGGFCADCCPHGRIGERLWVRETWAPNGGTAGGYIYRADHGKASSYHVADLRAGEWTHRVDRWKPSIHMPRAARRILLEITNVRVERLQEIGVEDIEAEGVVTSDADIMQHGCRARVMDWIRLWESTGGSWDANPWVWVIEFERVNS